MEPDRFVPTLVLMRVREIDVHDDAELKAWWEVSNAVAAYGREGLVTHWSLRSATVAFRSENNSMMHVPLAAFEGEQIIGVNQLHYPLLDNTHLAYVEPRVLPDHRRRGVGTALLEESVRLARAAGRRTVVCEVNLPVDVSEDSPNQAFAAAHGFELGILDLHRVLDLPVDACTLDRLEHESESRRGGYELVSWRDFVPPQHLEGYCGMQIAFNSEAPAGEMELEEEVWDEKRVRQAEERSRQQGRLEFVTVAIAPDGGMVGLTEMMCSQQTKQFAWQSGTLVLKPARGHRLGIAMKVANLRDFVQAVPECRAVHSWNAEENGPMVAINNALGFRPVERLAEMQLKL